MALNSDQERYLQRAREVLAEADNAGPDAMSFGLSVGALQWHLGEMIRMVEQLAGNA